MVDAVRLLSAGYSTRLPFETLEKQFKPLAPAKFQNLPANLFCVALLSAFDLGRADFLLGLTKAFFKSGKLAFVDSLMSGQKKLDAAFFAKMARLLALWRFRRGVSAVRCLIYLNAKMRRLRALWKFRRSASIASMIGSSWVRRTKEIRFGAAIERLQACGRGYLARRQRRKTTEALLLLQRMGRGHAARVKRDQARPGTGLERHPALRADRLCSAPALRCAALTRSARPAAAPQMRIEREKERKARAKADRERKIRERQEAMEAKAAAEKDAAASADAARREKLKAANAKISGPGDKLTRRAGVARRGTVSGAGGRARPPTSPRAIGPRGRGALGPPPAVFPATALPRVSARASHAAPSAHITAVTSATSSTSAILPPPSTHHAPKTCPTPPPAGAAPSRQHGPGQEHAHARASPRACATRADARRLAPPCAAQWRGLGGGCQPARPQADDLQEDGAGRRQRRRAAQGLC